MRGSFKENVSSPLSPPPQKKNKNKTTKQQQKKQQKQEHGTFENIKKLNWFLWEKTIKYNTCKTIGQKFIITK